MSPLVSIALAALVAGLVASPHCFAMCGPLACATSLGAGARSKSAALAWQAARLCSYALVGGLAGALGGGAAGLVHLATLPFVPWAMALLLVTSALRLFERLPELPFVARARRPLVRLGARFSPRVRAGAIGALTPLLPCGLFYGALAASLVAGSFARGALTTFSFGLGASPALALAQLQAGWSTRLPPWAGRLLRTTVPLAAAAVLVWRAAHAGATSCRP